MNHRSAKTLATCAAVLVVALVLAVSPALATTVTFRAGENGYTGAKDTFLQQSSPGANNGTAQNLNWDADDPNGTGYDVYTLIRFDNVFGAGGGQVPFGAQITSATLSYVVYNNGGDGELRKALVAWDPATATYTSYCGGGCTEGVHFGAQVGTAPAGTAALQSADVTATVQDWSNGGTNLGWFVQTAGTDGVDVRSSDYATVSERPILTIRYNEGPPSSNLVRQPYLQMVTPNSMTVVWRTDTATDSRVEYGTVFGTFDRTATNATVGTDHYVTITGLSPSTRYYYRVGSTTTVQGGGSADFYFTTAPLVGTSPRPFRFWIFGDSGICSDMQNTVRNSMLTYTGANPPVPDLFLHAGDVVQVSGTDTEYTNCHLAYYTTVLRHTPFLPAMGNHDSYSTSCQDPGPCTGPYFSTFVLPANAEMGGVASNTEAYYSWDYGNAHFIVLNGTNVSRSSTGPMANWLRSDLAATTQQWVIAYWHQPPYTKGTHDSDSEGDLIEMRANIIPILEEYGVDLVLNGHSHGYERSYLIDGTYTNPTPAFSTLLAQGNILDSGDGRPAGSGEYLKSPGKNTHEGTVYVVTATGAMGPGGAHNHPVMYFAESANGSTLVDVGANELNLTFLRSDGIVRDTFTIRKGDLPPRVSTANPAKGSVITTLPSVEVTFNMDVQGVSADDLRVNGSAATSVTGSGSGPYVFTGYVAPGQGTVSVVLAAGGIESVANPANVFTGDSWSYTLDTTPPRVASVIPARGATIGALPHVSVTFSKPVTGVTADDLTVNGSSATSVSGVGVGPYLFTGYTAPGNGLVTVILAAGSIVDGQSQPFGGDNWNYALTRRLVINEFLASNNTAAQDEYGEFDDYLEIYNPTDATVDMSGMFLTDDLDSKAQYRIPSGVTVPPRGHIVFWCDGQTSQGALHTNFNILRAGEDLGLFDTEDNGLAPIDTLTFTTQMTDVSSGRFPDGIDGFVSMPVTPGAANTITCSSSTECTALTDACNTGVCTGNRCVSQTANEGGACDDGVACTAPDTCTSGVCNGGADTCPSGQTCNHGTGICEATQLDPLPIDVGETWSYLKGTAEPTPADLTAWTRLDYSDAAWLSGASGFGYGTDCTAQTATTLSDMLNGYTSIYLRKAFRVNDPARVSSLTLTVDYDDAFVAYLNGTEVARRNVVGTPPTYTQLATVDHECSVCGGTCNAAEAIDISAFESALVAGTNVLAIQAHNLTLASSDFTIVPTLASTEIAGCIYDSECNDSNPCTDDVCNLGTGVCTNPTDNANPCTDGVACTTDACSAGACISTDSCFGGLTCNHTTGICESTPVSVTFQQDVAAYTGTQDSYLYQSGPNTVEGSAITWRWDTDDPPSSGMYEYGLVRFDGIFGGGAGQIPLGATITSATLTIYIENGTVAPAGSVNEVAVDWSEAATTWNNFGGDAGVQADEYGALVASAPVTGNLVAANITVTSSVQAWANGLRANYGWIFRPAVTDGVAVTSSEGATAANRPKLSVTYQPPAQTCDSDADCQDGLWCNGAETCNLATFVCEAGTPQICDDGVACTADSCNESTESCDHVASDAVCNDGNVCTIDTCNGTSGCVYAPNNGVSCEDGNGCTTGDLCSGGICTPGGPTTCNDGLACTMDSCVAPTGCQYVDNCPMGQTCSHTTGLCSAAPVTVTYQQGDTNGYTGTVDTYIDSALGSQATTTPIVIDGSPVEQALVRFDGIFGSGAHQVPVGATITSATLTLRVGSGTNDWSANPVYFHGLLNPWIATDVWAAYGVAPWNATGGIQADGVDAVITADATATMGTVSTAYPVDVTARVQAWANTPTSNHGWAILPLVTGTDGLRLESSESTTVSYRPRLSITYTAPVTGCTENGECDDGLFCNGAETCNLGTGTCQAGIAPDCDDAVDCTTDSCNETTDACVHAANDAACGDGNVCTDDTCSPISGCQHLNNTASCSDGNACTTGDACSGGTCVGGGATNCDDGVACTTDSCDTVSGCAHVSNCPTGQICNAGTGLCETSQIPELPIVQGSTWKYRKGLSEPTPTDLTAWADIGFDDSAWLEGPTGLGYDYYVETGGTNANGDYGPFIGTELADMRNCTPVNPPLCNSPGYASVYMRKAFNVTNPAAVTTLTFRIYADDGYVAYLNGTEVARIRTSGSPPLYNALATGGPSVAPPVEQTLDLTGSKGLLVPGVNVLAVQAHNVTLDSRDVLVIPQLSSTVTAGCDSNEDCNDSNPCTDDVCNLGTGVCSNTADDTNPCADGIACTADACTGGACVSTDSCATGTTCNHATGTCEVTPVTVTFRQGAGGYTGAVDTYISAGTPTTSYGTATTLTVDGVPPATDERQILIRFDGIFGDGPGQIPPGATITSASLTIYVSNAMAQVTNFHRMLRTWNATDTWDTFGSAPWNAPAGVQADGVEAVATPDVAPASVALSPPAQSIAVTPSVQAWAADPAGNFGWVLRAAAADSLAFDSAEGSTLANRPMLSVTYQLDVGPKARMACALASPTAPPGGTVGLEAFLENLGGLEPIRGYQTQLRITCSSGTVGLQCPGGVSIDDGRADYVFAAHASEDYPVTNCGLQRASSSIDTGGVTVGTSDYLASYTIAVGSDAVGATCQITFAPYPDSALASVDSDPIPFEIGPACALTVGSCSSAGQCDDGNPCTEDTCDAGVCNHTPTPGTACDDGNVCTTGTTCDVAGVCAGGATISCDDANVCTIDSCNPVTGCGYTNNTGSCDDGNACTTGDSCSAGICVGGGALDCGDGNGCTDDACSPATGCYHTNNSAPCDDGDACTTADACSGGTCVGGSPLDCTDLDPCTADSCSAGLCLHVPTCGITGTVRYYRTSASGGSEPTVKPTPNVGIDRTQDAVADAVTGQSGDYVFSGLHGNVSVATVNKFGAPRASDHNNAISSLDAAIISRKAVGSEIFSANQTIAGDVTGNGSISSLDAAKVAQFAVELIDHFDVAVSTGSDWKFLRCDQYLDEFNQNCTTAAFAHAPLTGGAVDDFYAVLYGDANGSWQPATAFAAASSEESAAAFADRRLAVDLKAAGTRPTGRPAGMPRAVLTARSTTRALPVGGRAELVLWLTNADGIEALDLRLAYDATAIRIESIRRGELAADFQIAANDVGGERRVAMYGVLPLQGSGQLLVVTVEALEAVRGTIPIAVEAVASEGRIPLDVRGTARSVRINPRSRNPVEGD